MVLGFFLIGMDLHEFVLGLLLFTLQSGDLKMSAGERIVLVGIWFLVVGIIIGGNMGWSAREHYYNENGSPWTLNEKIIRDEIGIERDRVDRIEETLQNVKIRKAKANDRH